MPCSSPLSFRTCRLLCQVFTAGNLSPPALPSGWLILPTASIQFKWNLWRRVFYLNGLYFYIFIVLDQREMVLVYLIAHLFSVPQWQELCLALSFLLVCTVPKHIGNEMLGKFYLPEILLKNPLFYYVYSENFHCKVTCWTDASGSPLTVRRAHWVREEGALDLSPSGGLESWLHRWQAGGTEARDSLHLRFLIHKVGFKIVPAL